MNAVSITQISFIRVETSNEPTSVFCDGQEGRNIATGGVLPPLTPSTQQLPIANIQVGNISLLFDISTSVLTEFPSEDSVILCVSEHISSSGL